MSMNPVGWFEIYVGNMARAKAFYENVLGVVLEPMAVDALEMMAFPSDPEGGGTTGALVCTEHVKPGGNSTVVYFNCRDCEEEAARVEPAGGKLLRAKFSIGDFGFVALAYDTEGNLIGLHSWT